MKIYLAYGINRLINSTGPCGIFKTREEAEAAGKEHCDKHMVCEYEVDWAMLNEKAGVKS